MADADPEIVEAIMRMVADPAEAVPAPRCAGLLITRKPCLRHPCCQLAEGHRMRLRRAAEIADTVIAADRRERTLAALHRIDSRAVVRNGGSAGNDTHHADLAEANGRAAVAEREAALWRATAEVLRLDRDMRRERAHRRPASAAWPAEPTPSIRPVTRPHNAPRNRSITSA